MQMIKGTELALRSLVDDAIKKWIELREDRILLLTQDMRPRQSKKLGGCEERTVG